MVEIIEGTKYLTIKEAAIVLRRHWLTVWRWTGDGTISYHQLKPGKKILIPLSEIKRLRESFNIL